MWAPMAFMGCFWIIGVALLISAINMGRRTAVLLAEAGHLRVTAQSLFGARQWEWGPGELREVRAGPSGMRVNNRPVLELQIQPTVGRKVGLLAGRDEDELLWMAARLHRALSLSAGEAEAG